MIQGLSKISKRVAGIKLTGGAQGVDLWRMLDAGALLALDCVDGGYPSTYLLDLDELLDLRDHLNALATAPGTEWLVVELADGPLQLETSDLLQSPRFRQGVDAWLFAAADPLAAIAGASLLRSWGIEPTAITGLVTQSPLALVKTRQTLDLSLLPPQLLQTGALNQRFLADQTQPSSQSWPNLRAISP